MLPFARIELGENFRQDLGDVAALAKDIGEKGLLQPLVVLHKRLGGGREVDLPGVGKVSVRYILIAGFRRYAALQKLMDTDPTAAARFKDVPVTLFHGSDQEARFAQLRENVIRKDMNAVELAMGLKEMLARGCSRKSIADGLKKSLAWVSHHLTVLEKCSDAVLAALRTGRVPLEIALTFSNLSHEKQDAALAKYLKTREEDGKGAARTGAKEDADKPACPSKTLIDQTRAMATTLAKEGKRKEDIALESYYNGVTDALDYVLGKNKKVRATVEREWREFCETSKDDESKKLADSLAGGKARGGKKGGK
jgi:ParB/RepB/Spo0J family partition protein